MNHPSLGIHTLFCSQMSSVTSPGKNSLHGDLKTPIRVQAMYLVQDSENIPSKTPQHRDLLHPNFDTYGLYTKRAINILSFLADAQQPPPMALPSPMPITQTPDYDKYRPCFVWVNTDNIRDTFQHTTQWGVSTGTFPMCRHLKSKNPVLNVPCRHEAVATDTVYSDTLAVNSGVKQAQLFVGKESLVSNIYPMWSDNQFVKNLEDNIHGVQCHGHAHQ